MNPVSLPGFSCSENLFQPKNLRPFHKNMQPIEGIVPPATCPKTRFSFDTIKPHRFGLPGMLLFTVMLGLPCQQIHAQDAGPAAQIFNRVRYLPTPGMEATMVGGKFEGSNV